MGKKVQVAVHLTVELDPDDWTLAYGVTGLPEIRKDVRRYAHNQVQQSYALGEGGEAEATVTLKGDH